MPRAFATIMLCDTCLHGGTFCTSSFAQESPLFVTSEFLKMALGYNSAAITICRYTYSNESSKYLNHHNKFLMIKWMNIKCLNICSIEKGKYGGPVYRCIPGPPSTWSVFLLLVDVLSTELDFLGCFLKTQSVQILKDFKGAYKPNKKDKLLQACAELAKDSGFTHFGVGENQLTCFGGELADLKGDAAPKKKCGKKGLGNKGALGLYQIKWGEGN